MFVIQKFNRKLVGKTYGDPSPKTGKITKWKREEFKRLLSGAIGVCYSNVRVISNFSS